MKRRDFLKSSASFAAVPAVFGSMDNQHPAVSVSLEPYQWEGPYAEYRTRQKALHDWRLCTAVKAAWFRPCERIILRTSEIIGHETGFLYDDHFPPSEPNGRGKSYRHIPFEWQVRHAGRELSSAGKVPSVGEFSIRLTAHDDYVDIALSVRNSMAEPMFNPDWAFCAVGFETFSVGDPEDERTFLYDGSTLRTLASIAGRDIKLYKVEGANAFIPVGHRGLPIGDVEAKASVVIIEAVDRVHSVALGFEQADHIYGDAKGNRCFHADPYFGKILRPGEERKMRGRLYLMKGSAQAALDRYLKDFGVQQSNS
jgi:hypothetical protein